MSSELTDDEITDRLSDEIVRRVGERHPHCGAEQLRKLVRAYTRQALGLRLTLEDVGAIMSEAPQRVHELEGRALARAWMIYRLKFPDLLS